LADNPPRGVFHPLGAAFYSNGSYPETLKIIDMAGVPSEPFALTGEREQFRFNDTSGEIETVPPLSPEFRRLLGAEIPRYIQLWHTVFAPYSVTGFKVGLVLLSAGGEADHPQKGVPDHLSTPGEDWFRANNFTALPALLVNPLALYGYGDIHVVPAVSQQARLFVHQTRMHLLTRDQLYILQYITPDILTAFIGQHDVYYTDFHKVFVEYAKKAVCKTPINLSHEIRCIDRSGKYPVLKYTAPHGNFYKWGKQECAALIMAFPPTVENLERAGLDLTEEENDVFKDVVVHNYFSSAVELALPYGVSYIAKSKNITVAPPNDGGPVAVLRFSQQSNVSTAWSWGPDDEYVPEKSTRQLLQTTLSKLNKDPRNMSAMAEPLCPSDIPAFRKWDYFPHFGTEALRKDAYAKLDNLQGCSRTFWASGLNGMETVEWAIRAGQDIVDSYLFKDGWMA
jgi:hypothetical protein